MTVRILAVDDMGEWRNYHLRALTAILNNLNKEFELTLKNSAYEAFEDIQANLAAPYDLILSDLQMERAYEPELAGEWLVRNIKQLKQYQTRPIIIVSAAWNIKAIAEKLNTDFLSKRTLINNPLTYELKIKELLF